jgi:hypothetical protein
MAYPMKPILHIIVKDPADIAFEEMERWASELGYALVISEGKQAGAKILSPKRMKRADYAACINAAKAMLKPTR